MRIAAPFTFALLTLFPALSHADAGELEMQPIPSARYEFGGVLGERLKANIDQWLLPCPHANPGMLEMFRMRDRKPVPQLVPWAGEFAGKYLISLVHALRATTDERLHAHTKQFVADLIATQSPEGYMGPFPQERRLLGEWDLWGHYHVIQGLLNWHEFSGDEAAMASARKAADFICSVYLDTGRRPIEAGSDEMNLAIIHAMARLHRITGEPRYLAMARVVEEDWEKAGDYLRQGLANVPFYKTPRPRWESLHDIQGMMEMYRITGDEKYKTAFKNLWTSIRDYDRHNTGGFTTGEQAIGDPYTPGAIETCCTVAWSCLGIDMLQLTGDSTVADELELSLFNGIMGAQHPSGRWFTYNTPMDGKKEASAHSIVFQARAGTPELNCCSVNGPRGLAMVTDWALMQGKNGELIINWLGPMKATAKIGDVEWQVEIDTDYPASPEIQITAKANLKHHPAIWLRNPGWNEGGHFVTIDREISKPTVNLSLRHATGDGAQLGRASFYSGPLLLAYDQTDNALDCNDVPPIDPSQQSVEPAPTIHASPPIVASKMGGVILRDYATAGMTGTEFRSWLPVANVVPAEFRLISPAEQQVVSSNGILFQWQGSHRPHGWQYVVEIAERQAFDAPLRSGPLATPKLFWDAPLKPGTQYLWRVVSRNPTGQTIGGFSSFTTDTGTTISPQDKFLHAPRDDSALLVDPIHSEKKPDYGVADEFRGTSITTDRHGDSVGALQTSLGGMARYKHAGFPRDAYSASLWVKVDSAPERMAQVCSAWAKGGDDPLRIVLEGGKIAARIEGMGGANTPLVPFELGKWRHIAAVKDGASLVLYIDGAEATRSGAPAIIVSSSTEIALGANPRHTGDESLAAAFDDFSLWARALSAQEVGEMAGK